LVNLARQLPGRGARVSAVLLADGPLHGWLEDVGCPVTLLHAGRTRQLYRAAVAIRHLAALSRAADVVISNESKAHIYGGTAAALARRPAVWWQHGVPSRSRIELTAAAVPSSAVVCGSRDAAAAQRRLTPRRHVLRIHPGTDIAAVEARAGTGTVVREQLGWPTARIVGIVGRLQQGKGQEVFLDAAARVARRHPDTRFLIVGGAPLGWDDPYPRGLLRMADELAISDRVHFAGHQDDAYPWMDAMDVVVNASFGESFGLVLVEAMALGKPLVATAAGGPQEIIEDGVSGLLVPTGDGGLLGAAVDRVLDDAALAQSLGAAARHRAGVFSSGRMAAEFTVLIERLRPVRGT
jgi:glycosyltransferase involved in cell wall biosynthesis